MKICEKHRIHDFCKHPIVGHQGVASRPSEEGDTVARLRLITLLAKQTIFPTRDTNR